MTYNRHSRRKAAREVGGVSTLRLPTLQNLILILLAVMALSIQTLVVQTHIHIPRTDGSAQTVSLVTLAAAALSDKPHAAGDVCTDNTPHDKYPVNEDPSNCPLCQEVVHCGQFVHSVAALASLPVSVTVNFIVFNEVLPASFAVSHTWRGRAPPQA
jgi:hypothetical protein